MPVWLKLGHFCGSVVRELQLMSLWFDSWKPTGTMLVLGLCTCMCVVIV